MGKPTIPSFYSKFLSIPKFEVGRDYISQMVYFFHLRFHSILAFVVRVCLS